MTFFEKIINPKNNVDICGLNDSLKALYVNNFFCLNNMNTLVVCNSLYEANLFYQNLSSFTNDALLFPMDDFLTSEALAISPELKVTRLETLMNVCNNKKIVITNLMGYLRFLPSLDNYKKNVIDVSFGDNIIFDDFITTLFENGYSKETIVTKTGDFSVRGFVIDIFPVSFENPIRIEFWGDVVDSIKYFSVDSQLTILKTENVSIYPITEKIGNGKYESNIYTFLDKPCVFFNDYAEIKNANDTLLEEIFEYNVSTNRDRSYKYMCDFYEMTNFKFSNFALFDNYVNETRETYFSNDIQNFSLSFDKTIEQLVKANKDGKTIIICFEDRYKVNRVFNNSDNPNLIFTDENNIYFDKINLILKPLHKGFEYNNILCISENEFFNKKSGDFKYKTNFVIGKKIRDINKLEVGDYIVHYSHGIGIYLGIKTLEKNGLSKDYIELQYKDGDKLYIPVERMELVSKYSPGDGMVPKINKLGSSEWQKTKLKVKKKIESIAADLLKLYAERKKIKGISFEKDSSLQHEFEESFEYKETIDQVKVISEIKKDMENSNPMDRLLCGDVGYGKTEVAFRAAFKAIMSGKQVAFLCPTTLLSSQHYKNAIERFSEYGVNVSLLNRYVTKKETSIILEDLKTKKIDILIGTHRILSDDVLFGDLGLLVIDEEQRFGVKHKEKIKLLKNNIDVLSLSATPIPRTLQMAISGLRGLSLLETPPVDRYPVQTYVLEENSQIIKDALYKELSRNGQAFILYNNIKDMQNKYKMISSLVPNCKIECAHGQMDKVKLEDTMMRFINKEFDILMCTTIIETGIDIPNVNTLIIMDADHFGLSQLYQIRGRVGRSNRIAYCYLMYNRGKILSEISQKRLKVIKDFTELGSGFAIAVRDLSIRGAGDILGSEQAGYIDSVGIEMFINMLNDEVRRLNGEEIDEIKEEEKPILEVATTISNNYIKEDTLKIEIHKMINKISSINDLDHVKAQFEDRFGKINEEILIYMYEELLEKRAKKIGIKDVRQNKTYIEIVLPEILAQKIDGQELFFGINDISNCFKLNMKNKKIFITLNITKLDKHFIYYIMSLFDIIEKSIKSE